MALNNPSDLFLYELSGIYDAEKKTSAWKDEIVGQIRDDNLQQLIRVEQQQGQQRVKNLEACFQALGTQPRDVPCLTIDGMRADFQQFIRQQPSPERLATYAVGCLAKMSHFGVGSYKVLVDEATTMGQSQCAQMLQSNLVMKEEGTGRLERISHEMNRRVMATA